MKDLVIIGAGGFGRELSDIVERINLIEPTWNLLGFIDDGIPAGQIVDSYPIIGTVDYLNSVDKELYAICALGVSKTRAKIISRISNPNIKYATIINPNALIYRDSYVGEGSVICGGTIATVNVKVGKHVIVNINCTLGHDDVIEDYCVINPGVNVSGNVVLGEMSDLGTGSKVLQGTKVVSGTVVGASGVVLKDITEPGTYVGVPVKKVK